jgi:hypothetical protein
MAVRLSALRAVHPLPPGRFLVLIISLSRSAAGRNRSVEKSDDLMWNRTRPLPACSVVPQPTMLPRVSNVTLCFTKTSVRNIFRSDIYSVSYPRVTLTILCTKACRYLRANSVTFGLLKPRFESTTYSSETPQCKFS